MLSYQVRVILAAFAKRFVLILEPEPSLYFFSLNSSSIIGLALNSLYFPTFSSLNNWLLFFFGDVLLFSWKFNSYSFSTWEKEFPITNLIGVEGLLGTP